MMIINGDDGWLLKLYILATPKVISDQYRFVTVYPPGYFIVPPPPPSTLGNQATDTMI